MSKIDVEALKRAASQARDGMPCRIPALEPRTTQSVSLVAQQCGGQNCHLDVVFQDGVTWIARVRLVDPLSPPQATQDYIFQSEVATLKFLEQTAVPSPRVYHFEPESPQNTVGTSYVLMEKMPGKPLDWNAATTSQRLKVMEQLADIFLELEKYPFDMTGSIMPEEGTGCAYRVGAFAERSWFVSPEKSVGPFSTLTEAYKAAIGLYQQAVIDREVSNIPVETYLSLHWRESRLSALTSTSASQAGPFYLKHNYDTGDHILVDEDFTITGITDWEFAWTEAKEAAFSSPCMMWGVADFYDGVNKLPDDEVRFAEIFRQRGRQDLCDIVMNGRRWQRFLFFIGGVEATKIEAHKALFQALRATFAEEGEEIGSYEEWRRMALENNPQVREILEERGLMTPVA